MGVSAYDSISISALGAQKDLWTRLEIATGNLANSTTGGFKRAMAETIASPDGSPILSVRFDFTKGALSQTGNQFDIAIVGEGFFQLEGQKLTRNGQFSIGSDGNLITSSGEKVMGDGGDITIPLGTKFVQIATDGTISTDKGQIGKIGIFKVQDNSTLQYGEKGYFTSATQLTLVDNPKVAQGYVEDSNVQAIDEMVNLIEISRQFYEAQRLIDEQTSRANKTINISSSNAI